MGMSTYVYGIKAPSARHKTMAQIRDACKALGIDEPLEVERYFENQYGTDASGERMDLPADSYADWSAEMQNGYQVEVAKLPPEVKYVRFVNSY